jgi:Flp pilus assembly protein TadD
MPIEVAIMLKRNSPAFAVVLFSLLAVVQVNGQGIPTGSASTDTGFGGVNTISGTVITSTGQRVEGHLSVRLRTMTQGDRISTTDDRGNFVFRGLPSGDYTILIDKEKDWEPFSQTVSVIQPRGMPPQTYYLSVRLLRKAAPIVKSSVINVDLAKIPKPAADLYNKAKELAKNGDHSGAIKQLQAAIAEYANFMLAYNELGVQYLRTNELEKADEALQSALKIEPEAYMPMMNRGIVLFTMKRYGEAAPVLRKVVEIKNDQAVGHYFLGETLANMGRFDEAEKELQLAVQLGGDEMKEAHRYLAILYTSKKDNKRAAQELETYLQLAPTTPDAEQLRTVIRRLKGEDTTPPAAKKPSP